jgi:hypothetical protein
MNNLFFRGGDDIKTKILNHLDLVFSNKKTLREKNIHKYFKVLGGNYKIDSDKSIHDSYKLFKLGIKNNIDVDTLVNKFKGSAPKLYDKLERKIKKKYLNKSDSRSDFSGGEKDKIDDDDDARSMATNLSGMSDIPPLKGYSEDRLPEYAILKFKTFDIIDMYDKYNKTHPGGTPTDVTNIYTQQNFIKTNGSNPNNWDLNSVLSWFTVAYKFTDGYKKLIKKDNVMIKEWLNHKTRYDEKYLEYDFVNLYTMPYGLYDSSTITDAPKLSTFFGSDGLLIGLYELLLHPTEFSKNMIQYLLYWFYFVESKGDNILNRVGWTKVDKANNNKIIFNPTAGLLMRLIEVLHYINIRYLYPQCIIKMDSCGILKTNNACIEGFTKIKRANSEFLSKLNKVEGSLLLKIQKEMTKGKYSTVFREYFKFTNFNEDGFPKYKDQLKFEPEPCDVILERGMQFITHTWSLMGGIKNIDNYDDYSHRRKSIHESYDSRREPIRESYNQRVYDRDYNKYDRNNRGGYERNYYPDNMHGGALGILRQEINRNL